MGDKYNLEDKPVEVHFRFYACDQDEAEEFLSNILEAVGDVYDSSEVEHWATVVAGEAVDEDWDNFLGDNVWNEGEES